MRVRPGSFAAEAIDVRRLVGRGHVRMQRRRGVPNRKDRSLFLRRVVLNAAIPAGRLAGMPIEPAIICARMRRQHRNLAIRTRRRPLPARVPPQMLCAGDPQRQEASDRAANRRDSHASDGRTPHNRPPAGWHAGERGIRNARRQPNQFSQTIFTTKAQIKRVASRSSREMAPGPCSSFSSPIIVSRRNLSVPASRKWRCRRSSSMCSNSQPSRSSWRCRGRNQRWQRRDGRRQRMRPRRG